MEPITVKELTKACGGRLLCGKEDTLAAHISIDSRSMTGGDLFVPLAGERNDAHRFIRQAFENGAAAVLTSRHKTLEQVLEDGQDPAAESAGGDFRLLHPWIAVEDTRQALQALGSYYRSLRDIPVVGITGSVGKTTTREMIAAALSGGFRVYQTPGNHNSQVGVPMTLSEISPEDEMAVIELGMSEPRELTVIARIARPDLAVITNIGVSHIGQLGSQEAIFREKMTIQDGLRDGGVLLLNGDDPFLSHACGKPGCRTYYYGTGEACQYRALDIHMENGMPSFTADCRGRKIGVSLQVPGLHQVRNAMAALAAADVSGVPLEAAAERLGHFSGFARRQQIRPCRDITVIDDTYNASPASMRAALDILASMEPEGRRAAVLADMKELGEEEVRFHRETGEYLAGLPVDLLVTCGTLAEQIGTGAIQVRPDLTWIHTENLEELKQWLADGIHAGDCVLFKGSNSMKLGEAADDVCQRHH